MRKTCTHCGTQRFGLIRYRRGFHTFCSKKCRERWDANYERYMNAQKRWFGYLRRAGP